MPAGRPGRRPGSWRQNDVTEDVTVVYPLNTVPQEAAAMPDKAGKEGGGGGGGGKAGGGDKTSQSFNKAVGGKLKLKGVEFKG